MNLKNVKAFIDSGILELYVSGITTDEETAMVKALSIEHLLIKSEIEAITHSLEQYALANPIAPDATLKAFMFAKIDFMERVQGGEIPGYPPALHQGSLLTDYQPWIDRKDMVLPETLEGFYAKIIGYTSEVTTAIVWIEDESPVEVHDKELESFLIAEGTCNITIDGKVHSLVPGDYLTIPLFKAHFVKVTSCFPCKVILQRMAA